MVTTLFKVYFKDGSIFNVICVNRSQVDRFNLLTYQLDSVSKIETVCNGIHNIKQFETIVNQSKTN